MKNEFSVRVEGARDGAMKDNKPSVSDLNEHLSCSLCSGYLIDAITLSDCLHSYCRSCLVKRMRVERTCPRCRSTIRAHGMHKDNALQDLVYKLIPAVYKDELKRRGDFYRQVSQRKDMKPVQIFDKHLVELAAFICTPDENVSLVIEYSPHQMHRVIDACLKNKKKRPHSASSSASSSTGSSSSSSHQQHQSTSSAIAFKRYFRCPAAVTVAHLKRLLRYKLELTGLFEIELLHAQAKEPLDDSMSLMDIAYIYSWRRNAPMQLFFTLCKADSSSSSAPATSDDIEMEQMPQLTREASPLPKSPPLVDADGDRSIPMPLFNVTLNSKLFDMSQTASSHPPIITTTTTTASPIVQQQQSTPARRQKRKPSSPSKKTKQQQQLVIDQQVDTAASTIVDDVQMSAPPSITTTIASAPSIELDSKCASVRPSSDSTSSSPSPVSATHNYNPIVVARMTGAPPFAKAPPPILPKSPLIFPKLSPTPVDAITESAQNKLKLSPSDTSDGVHTATNGGGGCTSSSTDESSAIHHQQPTLKSILSGKECVSAPSSSFAVVTSGSHIPSSLLLAGAITTGSNAISNTINLTTTTSVSMPTTNTMRPLVPAPMYLVVPQQPPSAPPPPTSATTLMTH